MAPDQYRSLSPEAVLATLRSLPRRYRAELSNDPSIDFEAVARSRQGLGPSPSGIVAAAAARITALADAVHRAAVLEHPTVTVAPATTADRGSLDAAFAALDDAVAHAAQAVDSLPTEAWGRRASVSGTGTGTNSEMTVLELAQECAREGVERLRELTALLDQLKHDR